MRRLSWILITITVAAAFSANCWAQSPLDGMSTLRDFRAMRTSSVDPNLEGNGDARPIAPGATLTLADMEGPGKIAHIWFTIADNERFYGKLLTLRIYWDGEQNPSVECPINDFFCEGHGLDMYVNSMPFRVTSDGRARNCYWPMPFGKSAKITVTNEGKQAVGAFYYYIDWQKLKKLPKDEAYFHAQYRQEYPCVKGHDYLIMDAEGKGHYVGCNLSVRQHEPGWWGEGDDRFYIDGEKTPSIQGTGSEDYFCDGWGIRKLEGLYYGFPISEGYDTLSRHTNYRFHIQDPVPFTKSLKMTIEHKGALQMPDGSWNGYLERFDDFSSVAYWYQTEPHKAFPKLPSGAERLYTSNSVMIEGEDALQTSTSSTDKPVRQDLGGCSGAAQLFFMPKEAPAWVAVSLNVPKDGKYIVIAHCVKSWDYGIYQAYFDGKAVGGLVDMYSDAVTQATPIKLGEMDLTAGKHELKYETTAKNPASKGFYLGLDCVELIPIPKPAAH